MGGRAKMGALRIPGSRPRRRFTAPAAGERRELGHYGDERGLIPQLCAVSPARPASTAVAVGGHLALTAGARGITVSHYSPADEELVWLGAAVFRLRCTSSESFGPPGLMSESQWQEIPC
jgi:hypothetical protein